ncbi:regulator of G-protein signaling 19 S homeolog isoform X5 [Xenopus laevis]|nr:regulator of G-protein signaling 19 S homeolog isoform X5 [Xenopus laevis]XP_041433614.1 regulator of G-protein signaling 19 S homeolog isoform X5 [Xenopus laevis]XP_041433615.1 regulator of G-protein signaling 19 S homeolog isoform X5 [Xenopus laevis]
MTGTSPPGTTGPTPAVFAGAAAVAAHGMKTETDAGDFLGTPSWRLSLTVKFGECDDEGAPRSPPTDSSKPSSEEVCSWASSFEKLMKNPAGRNVFREFLRTEYSEENMLFWLACEELKKDYCKHSIEDKARMIYEDYISILSPKEVSLDSRVREMINRRMQEPSSHTFDDAQLQIYTLMHRDSFPRFLNSGVYKSLLQNISRSSSES